MSIDKYKDTLRGMALQSKVEKWPQKIENTIHDALELHPLVSSKQLEAKKLPPPPNQERTLRVITVHAPRLNLDVPLLYGFDKNVAPYWLIGGEVLRYLDFIIDEDIDVIERFISGYQRKVNEYKTSGFFKNYSSTSERANWWLLDALLEDEPFSGTAIWLMYFSTLSRIERGQMTISPLPEDTDESFDAKEWNELWKDRTQEYFFPVIQMASTCFLSMNEFFGTFSDFVHDELTGSFLNDFKKDAQALILRSIRVMTQMTHEIHIDLDSEHKGNLPRLKLARFMYPISAENYDAHKAELDALIKKINTRFEHFAVVSDYLGDLGMQNEKNKYELNVPFLISPRDIYLLLYQYEKFWRNLEKALHIGKPKLSRKQETTFIDFPNGISFTLRDKAVRTYQEKKDARILIKGPASKGINIDLRVDKDDFVQSISLDYGQMRFEHVLGLMSEVAFSADRITMPSIVESNVLFLDPENQTLTPALKEIGFQNKFAFLVSAIMNDEFSALERVKDEGASYHVRKNMAKEEYYNNFSHIVDEIEHALMSKH